MDRDRPRLIYISSTGRPAAPRETRYFRICQAISGTTRRARLGILARLFHYANCINAGWIIKIIVVDPLLLFCQFWQALWFETPSKPALAS